MDIIKTTSDHELSKFENANDRKSVVRTTIVDDTGEKIRVQQRALPIINESRRNYGIREPFYAATEQDQEQILASPLPINGNVVTLSGTVAYPDYTDKLIRINEGLRWWVGHVISISGTNNEILTVDISFDAPFSTSALVDIGIDNMAVDGSVTPVVFKMQPPPLHKWIVETCLLHIFDSGKMSDEKFGSLPALNIGLSFKQYSTITLNAALIKQNADFTFVTSQYQYTSGGTVGANGLLVSGVFLEVSENGSLLLNTEERADRLECIVQDDLSSLDSLKIFARGYIAKFNGEWIIPEAL